MASVFRFEASEAAKRAARASIPSAPPASAPTAVAPIAVAPIAVAPNDGATQEIRVEDVLEAVDAIAAREPEPAYVPQRPLPSFARASTPTPPPSMPIAAPQAIAQPAVAVLPRVSAPPQTIVPPPFEARNAPSVAPVEIEVDVDDMAVAPAPKPRPKPADSTMQIILELTRVPRRIPQRRLGWLVAAALGVSVLILAAGVTKRALGASDDETRETLTAMVAQQKPVNAARPEAPKPQVAPPDTSSVNAPSNLAPSPVGTVIGPAGRVYIDGKQVRGTSAIIPCGPHAIRVAPATKAKTVDVPCGGEKKL